MANAVAAVMLIEQFTEQRAYPIHAMPSVPLVGDRIECYADIYLNENVMKALSPKKTVFVSGLVVERLFIDRNGLWVCHLKMARYAFQDAEPATPTGEGAASEEPAP